MERDFLGLSSKDSSVKEESGDGRNNDSALMKSLGMELSFSNKVSTRPQFFSPNTAQEGWPKKIVHDASEVSVFMDAFSSNHELHAAAVQGGVGSTINQLPLRGFPNVTSISSIPSASSILSTDDPRNALKFSGAASQMTIFYAGSVSVYEDVPPETVQAIMLLAGNGSFATTSKIAVASSQVPAPIPRDPMTDILVRNQLHASPVFSTLPAAPQSPKVAGSVGSTAPMLNPSAVPIARKASLARFLEKRKERAATTLPCNVNKKSPDCSIPGSNTGASLSANSVGSPLPATN